MSILTKLTLTKYSNMVVLNEPNDYTTFNDYPAKLLSDHDAIFIFVETLDEMAQQTKHIMKNKKLLRENGYLFFAYPKKGNKRYETFIHRDDIFPALKVDEDGYVDGSNIKFARMVSMDEVFTVVGLKHVKKKVKKTTPSSQSIRDYEGKEKDVEALLHDHPNELAFYQHLTPGYRKDWARYIFSAKQQKTRNKREHQMIEVLSQGYKTMDLFRMKKK